MKILLLLLLITATCTYAVSQSGRRVATRTTAPIQPPVNPEPEIPQPKPVPASLTFLPDTLKERRIRTLENNYFRLADFEGKVLVINLWASWCGPCRREVPEYEGIRKDFLGRDVEFIALTPEDPAEASEKVNNFVRRTGFNFILGWADRDMARTLMNGRRAIPQTLVIDTNGTVINHWVGYAPGAGRRLRETLDGALKQ